MDRLVDCQQHKTPFILELCWLFPIRGNLRPFVCSADRARLAAIVADRNSRQKHAQPALVVLLVLSRFPLIDFFEDVADPSDWEALAWAQARTNPRVLDAVGDLSLVPVARRVGGPGASWVMGAFTHVSPDRVSRFADGRYGVYCAGGRLETALAEHTHHMGRFYAASGMEAGWLSEVRQLIGALDAALVDLRGGGFEPLLDPDDYGPSQAFARAQRAAGAEGIVYPSVRHPPGECIAAFYADVVGVPAQGDHFRYYWDGRRITYARKITGDRSILKL